MGEFNRYLNINACLSIISMKCITIVISHMLITNIYAYLGWRQRIHLNLKTQELEKASIHPSIKTDLANAENHRSTKSHSRSYSPNHTMVVSLIDTNRPKPMNSFSIASPYMPVTVIRDIRLSNTFLFY